MQYITLEHIDQYIAKKATSKKHFSRNILKEVFQFGAFFLGVFLLSTIVVNANLFYHTMKSVFSPVRADDTASNLITISAQQGEAEAEENSKLIEEQIQNSAALNAVLPDHTKTMSYYLSAKMKSSHFQFNTLPPENRLIIPAIGINAPIVDVSAATEQKLRNGDFDQELYS